MKPRHFNRKAGHVTLKVTDRARAFEHTTEASATAQAMREALYEVVHILVDVYAKAGRIDAELVATNRILTAAEYVEPVSEASMAVCA